MPRVRGSNRSLSCDPSTGPGTGFGIELTNSKPSSSIQSEHLVDRVRRLVRVVVLILEPRLALAVRADSCRNAGRATARDAGQPNQHTAGGSAASAVGVVEADDEMPAGLHQPADRAERERGNRSCDAARRC